MAVKHLTQWIKSQEVSISEGEGVKEKVMADN